MRGEASPAPSFLQFRQTLVEGRLFAIVTARGHDPRVIEAGVRHFIEMVLSESERAAMLANLRGYLECYARGHKLTSDSEVLDYYLGLNKYHGVMSAQFRNISGSNTAAPIATEAGKQFAIRDFVEHVMQISQTLHLDKPISIGFSDDDVNNLLAVESYIRHQLADEFPSVKFVVYDTSDPEIENGRKTIVSDSETAITGRA